MDLDELLDASAPAQTPRTPRLQQELDDLVAACEAAQIRKRRPARVVVVGCAVAGVLGVGAVASAAGVLPGWPAFSTSSGQTCQIEMFVGPLEPGEGEPVSATFSPEVKKETLARARTYLSDFDYNAVDRTEAISWFQARETRARAAQADPAERQPMLTGDDLEVSAVGAWVIDHLATYLTDHGLDIRAIDVGFGDGCVR